MGSYDELPNLQFHSPDEDLLMKTLAVTKSFNDLYMDSKTNSLAIHTGKEAYADIINAAIRTIRGEMQLNIEGGIPYMETVFDNPSRVVIWKTEVEEKIESFDFVNAITDFTYDIDYDNHTLHYKATIETIDGEVTIEG